MILSDKFKGSVDKLNAWNVFMKIQVKSLKDKKQTLFPLLVMNNKTYTSLYCDSVINQAITSDCAFPSGLFLAIKSAILSSPNIFFSVHVAKGPIYET